MLDSIKRKLNLLTWTEIVEYRKSLECPWLYAQNVMTGRELEKKILKQIFEQISKKEQTRDRLTFGFEMMFASSAVFSGLVKNSSKPWLCGHFLGNGARFSLILYFLTRWIVGLSKQLQKFLFLHFLT